MLRVSQVHVIRHKVLVENQSVRSVAKQMNCSRNTVRKYLKEGWDGAERPRKARVAPKRDEIRERVEALLEEWSTRTTAKQRVTGTLLHKALRAEGFEVGMTTVRQVFREWKRRREEAFVPLTYRPGEVAQVDFFEVVVEIDGQQRKAWLFVMRLMYSGRDFAWMYDRADQVAFLDAHVRAFEHFGGIPQRIVYDNLKAAVKRVLYPGRELAPRFSAMSAHYVFEPNFARPGEGHDKGGVESRGKNIRLQHLTPIPRGDSLDELSTRLLACLDDDAATKGRRDGTTIAERFRVEQQHFVRLPERRFEARRVTTCSVPRTCRVQLEGTTYSVWTTWKGETATALIGPSTVELRLRGQSVIHPRGRFGESKVLYRHFLPELARKPQAVRQVMPELLRELGEPFAELWRLLVDTAGPLDAARRFARVLAAIVERGEGVVATAIRGALSRDRLDLLDLEPAPSPPEVAVPPSLAGYVVEAGSADDYDQLLGGES